MHRLSLWLLLLLMVAAATACPAAGTGAGAGSGSGAATRTVINLTGDPAAKTVTGGIVFEDLKFQTLDGKYPAGWPASVRLPAGVLLNHGGKVFNGTMQYEPGKRLCAEGIVPGKPDEAGSALAASFAGQGTPGINQMPDGAVLGTMQFQDGGHSYMVKWDTKPSVKDPQYSLFHFSVTAL
jgi:hypothetical protein